MRGKHKKLGLALLVILVGVSAGLFFLWPRTGPDQPERGPTREQSVEPAFQGPVSAGDNSLAVPSGLTVSVGESAGGPGQVSLAWQSPGTSFQVAFFNLTKEKWHYEEAGQSSWAGTLAPGQYLVKVRERRSEPGQVGYGPWSEVKQFALGPVSKEAAAEAPQPLRRLNPRT